MTNHFKQDCLDILTRRAVAGKLDRRSFVKGAALLLGLPAALRADLAFAAGRLVLANWGGDAIEGFQKAFGEPFTRATGIPVEIDGSGPTEGALKAQITSGKIIWDVLDTDANLCVSFGRQGALEPIDYDVVDRTKIRPGLDYEFGVPDCYYSFVLAYDSRRFGEEGPTSPSDFWNVEKFPGKRTMYKWMNGMLEAALLADGVMPEELYPLDIPRALAKIEALKPHIISFWGSGAESQQLLTEGEAAMGYLWNTRAILLGRDTKDRVKWSYDGGFLTLDTFVTPKGNPAGRDTAMRFIAQSQDPVSQVKLFEFMGNGPANPEADALIPEEQRHLNCVSPEASSKQVFLDVEWYADNYSSALEKYLEVVSS
ncbi:putative spermidine/putrescine transport system substrate-binding protein [Mesorhizobium soli]|uniref:ABC transporter substrate-binding protein n=1 Tax=Pseudaminobacter soli (ex Li et al. 2025) TaxID=1295366 RepID=UPI0024762343|nr:ABC transporter substrate-binding protein [Mesorhizobium soli]MDH6233787.1 putative spermidine/putrescine transport system substrate-binding protein [Mesorhizobium soli]